MAGYASKYRGRRRNEPRIHPPSESVRTSMLNLNRISSFRYSIREIMAIHKVDEEIAASVVATVIAKGSRMSIAAAMDYVQEREKAGAISKDASNDICDLLDRYTKYR